MYKHLSCIEAQELLSAFVDKELSQGLEEAVEIHLEKCEECFQKYLQINKLRQYIKRSGENAESFINEDFIIERLKVSLDEIDDCRFTENNLNDYVDKELDEPSFSRIKKHLKNCKYCKNDYDVLLDLKSNLDKYFSSKSENTYQEYEFEKIISRIAKAKFIDLTAAAVASFLMIGIIGWFSVKTVYPYISKIEQDKSIQQINLKHTYDETKKEESKKVELK